MKADKKEIDDKVFLRAIKNLFFYLFYISDKIIMFWKTSQTPSFISWRNQESDTVSVVKTKKSGFITSYRKSSMIRVCTTIAIYTIVKLIF
jgi:hypothetical protein